MIRAQKFLALLLVTVFTGQAAETHSADACDQMAATLVADYGAVFERRTPGGVLHFKHPATLNFTIDCSYYPKFPLTLNLTWDAAFPPRAYFEFVGQATEVVMHKPAHRIETAAKKCQRSALAGNDGDAELHVEGLELGCSAFTQNGGGTHISIRPDARP